MANEIASRNDIINEWKSKISEAWQRSVGSIIEVGKLIKSAKEELGISYTLLETELPFSTTVAAYLVKISDNPVLSNPQYYSKLPSAYNTLYHLTSVDDDTLIEQLNNGIITPDFGLSHAKQLREISPKTTASSKSKSEQNKQYYDVGTVAIHNIGDIDNFEKELFALLKKYDGKVNFTAADNSLRDAHIKHLHKIAMENISKSEAELVNINLTDLRILEDAAHYLSKPKSQSHKVQIAFNDELVERTGLPPDYPHFNKICEMLSTQVVTRALLKKYVKDNKIPNQFTELTSMDKQLYVWEQVRLVTEKRDVKGGLKKLKDMATHSTIPEIKALAAENLAQLNRFNNRV
jgi:hypothetical protein